MAPRIPLRGGGAAFRPTLDVCLKDKELRTAVQDVAIGRWAGLRDLMERTGRDWDRRTFRVRVLADAAAAGKCVEAWQIAQSDNPDATVLRAEVEVVRVFRLAARDGSVPLDRLDAALQACLKAARAAEGDPAPLVSLLTVARLYPNGHPGIHEWWAELLRRDTYNREGCHQAMRYFSDRYHGSEEVALDFARDVAQRCPIGSPLTVLPLVARVEAFRFRSVGQSTTAPDLNDRWLGIGAVSDLEVALGRWFNLRIQSNAQDVSDLHYLAHGLCYANRSQAAAPVFKQIGDLVVGTPWTLFGEPVTVFSYWRNKALGLTR